MKHFIPTIILLALLAACADEQELLVPLPNDVTLNELSLGRFTHVIPDGGFTARAAHANAVTFNTRKNADGTHGGFAYSNRNNRSFTWTNTPEALDSNIFSVYTRHPNANGNYAVARATGDDAFFTLETPAVVEHVLVANTTYVYLAIAYGDQRGTATAPATNPNIPGASSKTGVWYTNVPGGVRKMEDKYNDYFRLTASGYNGTAPTGKVIFYLCTRKGDPQFPDRSLLVNDWYKMDLSALGVVSKVVFHLESSDLEAGTGRMRTPPYFCLDGVRLAR
jgi:hypothetical protein